MTKSTGESPTLEAVQARYFELRDQHLEERRQAEAELRDLQREAATIGYAISEAASATVRAGGMDARPLVAARSRARTVGDDVLAAEARQIALQEQQASEVIDLLEPYRVTFRQAFDESEREYAAAQRRRLEAQRTLSWATEQLTGARQAATRATQRRHELAERAAATVYLGSKQPAGVR